MEPTQLITALEWASKIANTPIISTVIDRMLWFKLSEWEAKWEVRKYQIKDDYEKAKENGVQGVSQIEDMRKATNLINVGIKTSEYIDPLRENKIDIDNDFFWNTIEHSKTVSNEEVQDLLAKIIAWEYNSPWEYTMSTLSVLKNLWKNEIEMLERIAWLFVHVANVWGSCLPDFLFHPNDDSIKVAKKIWTNYGEVLELQNLSILSPNHIMYPLGEYEGQLEVCYFNDTVIYEKNMWQLKYGFRNIYQLSKAWAQIVGHLSPKANNDYLKLLREKMVIQWFKLA